MQNFFSESKAKQQVRAVYKGMRSALYLNSSIVKKSNIAYNNAKGLLWNNGKV